jgi:hypothetical protein
MLATDWQLVHTLAMAWLQARGSQRAQLVSVALALAQGELALVQAVVRVRQAVGLQAVIVVEEVSQEVTRARGHRDELIVMA